MKHRVEFIAYRQEEKSLLVVNGVLADEHTQPCCGVWVDGAYTRLKQIGCETPEGLYKVIYTLAPKHGLLRVTGRAGTPRAHTFMELSDSDCGLKDGYYVKIVNCKLPPEWLYMRFNRKVVTL